MGLIDECELTFDEQSGRIHTLVLPNRGRFLSFFSDKKYSNIHWQAIRRIGGEVIIVDVNNSYDLLGDYGYSGSRRERRSKD